MVSHWEQRSRRLWHAILGISRSKFTRHVVGPQVCMAQAVSAKGKPRTPGIRRPAGAMLSLCWQQSVGPRRCGKPVT